MIIRKTSKTKIFCCLTAKRLIYSSIIYYVLNLYIMHALLLLLYENVNFLLSAKFTLRVWIAYLEYALHFFLRTFDVFFTPIFSSSRPLILCVLRAAWCVFFTIIFFYCCFFFFIFIMLYLITNNFLYVRFVLCGFQIQSPHQNMKPNGKKICTIFLMVNDLRLCLSAKFALELSTVHGTRTAIKKMRKKGFSSCLTEKNMIALLIHVELN